MKITVDHEDYVWALAELFEIGYRDVETLVKFLKFAENYDIEWREDLYELVVENLTLDRVFGDVVYSICWKTVTLLIDEYAEEVRDELYDFASELIHINYMDTYCPIVSDVIDGLSLQEAWENFINEAANKEPYNMSKTVYKSVLRKIKERRVEL